MKKYFLNEMTKLRRQLNHLFLYSIVIAFFSISCEKEPDQLGLGVLPGSENFVVTDTTFYPLATTIKLDSVVTFFPDTALSLLQKLVLGEYIDPYLGKTQASVLFNFNPDSVNHSFGTNPKVDSLMLFLGYDSVSPNKNSNFKLNIFELAKPLSYKAIYYANVNDMQYKGRLLVDTIIQFKDSVLKIKIKDPEYITKLLNTPTFDKYGLESYQEYVTGLYIEVTQMNNPGALAHVFPWYQSAKYPTRMALLYQNDTKDSIIYNYRIRMGSARINRFTHDYTGTAVETALQNTEPEQKITYVQGLGGLGTRIQVPNILKWAVMAPVSINKAELIIPVDTLKTDPKLLPQNLSIMSISDNGKRALIEYGLGKTFIGGLYNKSKGAYIFNVTKHIQKIANSKKSGIPVNTDFVIVADGSKIGQAYSFSSVALDFSSGKGAKLKITYSKQ